MASPRKAEVGDLPPNGIPTQGKFGYDSAKRRGIAVVAVAAVAVAAAAASFSGRVASWLFISVECFFFFS